MLHRLGVDMGEGHFQEPDKNNQKGYYEDLRFQLLAKSLTGDRYGTRKAAYIPEKTQREYSALIQERSTCPLWGFNGPRTVFILRHILPLFKQASVDLRFIIIMRDIDAVTRSLMKHSEISYGGRWKMTPEHAMATVRAWTMALREAVTLTDKDKAYCVLYEEILKDPQLAARRLADFAYAGIDTTATSEQIADAAEFVDRGLNHNGNSGSSSHA